MHFIRRRNAFYDKNRNKEIIGNAVMYSVLAIWTTAQKKRRYEQTFNRVRQGCLRINSASAPKTYEGQ